MLRTSDPSVVPHPSMDPLVIIAPLHLALSIVQWYCDDRGWFDYTGLWQPYVQKPSECGYRSVLRGTAEPFVPGPSHGGGHSKHVGPELEGRTCDLKGMVEKVSISYNHNTPAINIIESASID